MVHIDPASIAPCVSTAVGIAGGILGGAFAIRSARLGDLRAKIEEMGKQIKDLTLRCGMLEFNLDEERKKVGLYYGQASDYKDENIALRKEIQAKDDKIISLQGEMTDIYKNTLKAA